jgi:ribosome-associated protein
MGSAPVSDPVGEDGRMSSTIVDVVVAGFPIRLGQFLKLAGLAEHGAGARELVETDQVLVNGQVEGRRGAQLQPGDVVTVAGKRVRAVAA